MILICQCVIDIVRPVGHQLDPHELGSNGPELVVDAKLHALGDVQKKKVTHLAHYFIGKRLNVFHFLILFFLKI